MISTEVFKYVLTGGYVALVYWLSWIGMRRTQDISGFAIGNKDMSPYIIGITLAASIASITPSGVRAATTKPPAGPSIDMWCWLLTRISPGPYTESSRVPSSISNT